MSEINTKEAEQEVVAFLMSQVARIYNANGMFLVNYLGTFFFTDALGNYVPCEKTLTTGELVSMKEYAEILLKVGGDNIKELTPFLRRRAAHLTNMLKNDTCFMLSKEQILKIKEHQTMILIGKKAALEGVSTEEYVRREAIRAERRQKQADTKRIEASKKAQSSMVKSTNGRTTFAMKGVKGFAELRNKFSLTGS